MAEIIDIALSDDEVISIDDEPLPKRKKVFRCLNADCRKENSLIRATKTVKRYYGTLAYPKKNNICAKCSAYAKLKSEAVYDSVRNGQFLVSHPDAGNRNTVVFSDSESDPSSSDSSSDNLELENDSEESVEADAFNIETNNKFDTKDKWKELVSRLSDDLGLKKQIEDGSKIIQSRLKESEKGFEDLDNEYKDIEKEIDSIRNNFYDCFKPDIKFLPSIDIDPLTDSGPVAEVTEIAAESSHYSQQLLLPPVGTLEKPELKSLEYVFSIRFSLFSKWVQAVIISLERINSQSKFYSINYGKHAPTVSVNYNKLVVPAKNLAYFNACPTRIPVGTRVIAKYKDDDIKALYTSVGFYVGIVAEIPTLANKYRYLIFFDDGYAQYVNHHDIRVVAESSIHAWEDVASDSREFIKDYLHTYPERPMVRLQNWNYIKTEWSGRWYKAQVLEVDGSLVKMYFPMDSHTEWIYRGSTRLSPLFNKKLNIQSKFQQQSATIRRRTMPFNRQGPVVEYINTGQLEEAKNSSSVSKSFKPGTEKRAVARKSTSGRPGTPPPEVQELIFQESRGIIKSLPVSDIKITFVPHQCSPSCVSSASNSTVISPLMKPILEDWRRQHSRQKKKSAIRTSVTYVAPCGRRLRSIEDTFHYLRITESNLEIDYFSYDCGLAISTEWWPSKKNFFLSDISTGVEAIPVTCVNSLDLNVPNPLIYCNERQPTENVNLNTDPAFLVCCSCEDDCEDKSKCPCCQLTIQGAKRFTDNDESDIGYQYRRLYEQVPTGIYECNSLCSCKKSCLNRVAQHSIRYKLQLFKTARRGWGVRTLHDIPDGGFICIYVGKVLSEAEANIEGKITGGDDYYAELDFIEVAEEIKEGYESDVAMDEDDETWQDNSKLDYSDKKFSSNTNGENFSSGPVISSVFTNSSDSRESLSLEKKCKRKNSSSSSDDSIGDDDSEEENIIRLRKKQAFEPNLMTGPNPQVTDHRSVRELYGKDESVYIMDAKVTGNVGRYFNHSCQPNVYVQNVFVDTHDVRFPWVAFFASTPIRAGVELTWDYNYEVGSVQGKIKYCFCMAKKCRGRLL